MVYDLNATTDYIRRAAQARGIDPDTAVRVARSEGLARGTWQSNLSKNGRREPSYGPFQMLVGGGETGYPTGLGNDFQRSTGLDPSDPRNVNATIDFALDHASKNGWGAWYGAKHAGIGNRQGIGGSGGGQTSPLVDAVASRNSGSDTLAGGASGDTLSQPSGGNMAAPTVSIGLKPERSTKLYDAMLERALANGGKSQNAWDVFGNLAQVWAASSEKKEAEAENASELQKALAGAGLDPAYAMAAQLTGGREGAASAIMAQQQDRTQAANRAEQRADRLDERGYQRGQDQIQNDRADRSIALQEEVARRKAEGFRDATPEEARARNVGAGQFGPDGRFYPIEPAKAQTINIGGGENKQVFDAMDKSTEAARAAATGLKGLAEAKRALNGGIISGAGADTILGLQKVGAFMGVTDPSIIQNTETFRSAIAPQVAAMVKATVGSANISNSDREFAEKAAGGNITLDQGSILRLVDIMDRAGRATIQSHQERLNKVYPDGQTYGRERALFEIPMPEALPVPENDKLVPGSDGGGAAAPNNRTKRGVSWSVQ